MALGTAKTIIEQAGLPLGTIGAPRRDIVIGVPVVIRNASDANVTSHRWKFIQKPNASTATIADPIAPTCVFTPDVVGTWIVELEINEGVPPNQKWRTIVAVEDPVTGWRFPSYKEEGEANGWLSPNTGVPNKQGWADDLLHVLSDILNFVQPTTQSYVTVNNDTGALPNSRRLVQSADLVISDGGAGNPITFSTAYLIGTRRTLDVGGSPENVRAVRSFEAPSVAAAGFGQVNLGSQDDAAKGTKGNYATIAGGFNNLANDIDSTVGGGRSNTAGGEGSVVCGGSSNTAGAEWSVICGGSANATSDTGAVVVGGNDNQANATYASVLGGQGNAAIGGMASVCGGTSNTGNGFGAIVGAGAGNSSGSDYAGILAGTGNTTAGEGSAVVCGNGNQTFAQNAGVLCGSSNSAVNTCAAVLGGSSNLASGVDAAVVGGIGNTASGTRSLAGGGSSQATATGAIALGTQCLATHSGSMVLGDSQAVNKSSSTTNEATLSFGNGIKLLGAGSVEIRQHSGFTTEGLFFRTGAARTTDAVAQNVTLYSIIEDRAINVRGIIVGKQEGSVNCRSFAFNRTFLRQGGVLTAMTAHQSDAQVNGAAAWTTAITSSGFNIVVQFAGAGATTIDWAWNVMFQIAGEGS